MGLFAGVLCALILGSEGFAPSKSALVNVRRLGLGRRGPLQRRVMTSHIEEVSQLVSAALDSPAATGSADLWQAYLGLLESDPLPTKSVTAAVIIGAGDAAAQAIENSESEESSVDVPRVLRWALFGLLLQAPWNHFFYLLLDGSLPPTPDPFTSTTLIKVAIDQFVQVSVARGHIKRSRLPPIYQCPLNPYVQAPVFTAIIFVFFALVEGKGFSFAQRQISEELGQVLLKNWAIFLPATAINLAFLPNELRVLFLNGVFFFWVIFLSLTVNGAADTAEADP